MKTKYPLVIGLIIGGVLLSACQPLQQLAALATETPPPTSTDRPTKTPNPTKTPEPTATNTPKPTATATATATPNATATAQALATATTEAAISEINDELKKYDFTTETGHLGWLNKPVNLKLTTYLEKKHSSPDPELVVSDFILHTDITWKTTTGLSGCGLLFNAAEDFDKGKQYRFFMIRLQGLPLWEIMYFNLGRFQDSVSGETGTTDKIFSDQGSTNRIVLISQDNKITVYSNDERLGSYPHSKLKDGRIAFFAYHESGETTCTFENNWLWVLD